MQDGPVIIKEQGALSALYAGSVCCHQHCGFVIAVAIITTSTGTTLAMSEALY